MRFRFPFFLLHFWGLLAGTHKAEKRQVCPEPDNHHCLYVLFLMAGLLQWEKSAFWEMGCQFASAVPFIAPHDAG